MCARSSRSGCPGRPRARGLRACRPLAAMHRDIKLTGLLTAAASADKLPRAQAAGRAPRHQARQHHSRGRCVGRPRPARRLWRRAGPRAAPGTRLRECRACTLTPHCGEQGGRCPAPHDPVARVPRPGDGLTVLSDGTQAGSAGAWTAWLTRDRRERGLTTLIRFARHLNLETGFNLEDGFLSFGSVAGQTPRRASRLSNARCSS